MMELLTPPLPLPFRGGELGSRHTRRRGEECLTEYLPRMTAQPLPAPEGEGQGWGLYLNQGWGRDSALPLAKQELNHAKL